MSFRNSVLELNAKNAEAPWTLNANKRGPCHEICSPETQTGPKHTEKHEASHQSVSAFTPPLSSPKGEAPAGKLGDQGAEKEGAEDSPCEVGPVRSPEDPIQLAGHWPDKQHVTTTSVDFFS